MALDAAEKLAAFLLAPTEAPRPAADELPDAESFAALVEKHKLPLDELLIVNNLQDDPLARSACVQGALEEDRALHRRVRDEFTALRERLDRAAMPHVLLKAVHAVPYRSDNIDILVRECDLQPVGRMLVEMGYIHFLAYTDRYKVLYKRVEGARLTGMFHVHRAVAWYAPFIEPDVIFEGAEPGGEAGLRRPRREIALAIIGCHAMYEDAALKFIELHKVRHVLRQGPIDWNFLWQAAEHRGFAPGLALFLLILDRQHRTYIGRPLLEEPVLGEIRSHLRRADGTRGHFGRRVSGRDLQSPYKISKYFARRCLFRELAASGIVGRPTKLRLAGRILYHGVQQVTGWRPQRPMLAAVCGPDGCGKSTQVELLAGILDALEVRTVRSWRRIGDSPALNFLKSPLRRRVRAEVRAGQASEQGQFKSRLLRRLWPWLAVPDYLLRQYLAIGWAYLRQRMVIADRYHVDALVDLAMRCGPQVLKKRWVVLAMRLLPKARPAFVLEVPDETLRRRCGAEYIEGVSDRSAEYYRQAARLMHAEVVPAEGEPGAIADGMLHEILRRFFRAPS